MDLKRILAGGLVAALHGLDAATAARREFTARFSKRSFGEAETLPVVALDRSGDEMLGAVIARDLGFTPSFNAAKRIAEQNGLRVILEGRRRTADHDAYRGGAPPKAGAGGRKGARLPTR